MPGSLWLARDRDGGRWDRGSFDDRKRTFSVMRHVQEKWSDEAFTPYRISAHIRNNLFDRLLREAFCCEVAHGARVPPSHLDNRHGTTRLRLEQPEYVVNVRGHDSPALQIGDDPGVSHSTPGQRLRSVDGKATIVNEPRPLSHLERLAPNCRRRSMLEQALLERCDRVIAGTQGP